MKSINTKNEAKGIMQRYGFSDMLSSALKGIRLYRRNPNHREFVKRFKEEGLQPENLEEYFTAVFISGIIKLWLETLNTDAKLCIIKYKGILIEPFHPELNAHPRPVARRALLILSPLFNILLICAPR